MGLKKARGAACELSRETGDTELEIMGAKLIIDLAKCKLQGESNVQCSYKHHPENKGIDALLEMVRFALICRKCEAAPCVKAWNMCNSVSVRNDIYRPDTFSKQRLRCVQRQVERRRKAVVC